MLDSVEPALSSIVHRSLQASSSIQPSSNTLDLQQPSDSCKFLPELRVLSSIAVDHQMQRIVGTRLSAHRASDCAHVFVKGVEPVDSEHEHNVAPLHWLPCVPVWSAEAGHLGHWPARLPCLGRPCSHLCSLDGLGSLLDQLGPAFQDVGGQAMPVRMACSNVRTQAGHLVDQRLTAMVLSRLQCGHHQVAEAALLVAVLPMLHGHCSDPRVHAGHRLEQGSTSKLAAIPLHGQHAQLLL